MRTESEYEKIVTDLHSLPSDAVDNLPDANPSVDFSIRLAAMETRIEEMQKELKNIKLAS